MSYKNTYIFRATAITALVTLFTNIVSPLLITSYAVGTNYYIDFNNGSDGNDGLDVSTPWKTFTHITGGLLGAGDNVWLACGSTWTGGLMVPQSGAPGSPIVFRPWQNTVSCFSDINHPYVEGVDITNQSNIDFFRVNLSASGSSPSLTLANANNINITEGLINNTNNGVCIDASSSSGITLSGNTFSVCTRALSGTDLGGNFSHNILSGMTENAVELYSNQSFTIANNTFSNLQKGAIVFGQATTVSQNSISNACQGTGTGCSAIQNETISTPNTSFLPARVTENIIQDVGNSIIGGSYGISVAAIRDLAIDNNTINNAEEALHVVDANSLNIHDNTFVMPRARVVSVVQNTPSTVLANTFQSNTILGRNPDYPYIEMRDETAGGSMGNFLNFSSTKLYPLFKPNTSFVREVKYGGETREYTKNGFSTLDPSVTKFEYFGYKPYTSTGFASSNLIGNSNFSTNTSGWTSGAAVGSAPTLSYNTIGSDIGGSATITPPGGSPDRFWMTNDTNINLATGSTYLVTGYAKSSSRNINLRVFFHSASDKNIVYSDRIAETYASVSGGTFSLYLQALTGASDGRFTLETSNPDVSYELDEITVKRMSPFIPNNNPEEILIISNTGATTKSATCPTNLSNYPSQCDEYAYGGLDKNGANIVNWSSNAELVLPHQTFLAFWSNSVNILNTPDCSNSITGEFGSVPAGKAITIGWNIPTTSLLQSITYSEQSSGTTTLPVGLTGSITFIPPYSPTNNSEFIINATNDVGTRACSVSVTPTNVSPNVFAGTVYGTEDDYIISGTLSGIDYNPGDQITFDPVSPAPSNGIFVQQSTGSHDHFDFYPVSNYCNSSGPALTFEFSARDQLNAQSSTTLQTINITCVNDAPFLNSLTKSASGYIATPLLIDLIEGAGGDFTDPDSPYEAQTFTVNYTQPANGSVVLGGSSTQLQYTSNLGFSGTDSLQYSITDQNGATTATGTLSILVTRFNNAPTTSDTGYTLSEDTLLVDTLTGSDIDGDPLSFSAVTMPLSGGLVVLPGGSFTYTPSANFNGADSFIFQVSDGSKVATGTVSLTVTPVPDAPVAVADSYTLSQDTITPLPVMSNDYDVDSTTLTLTGYTSPSHGIIIPTGVGFTYTPNTGYVGTDSFTYQIADDTTPTPLLSSLVTVSLTVTSTNSPPVSSDIVASTSEDTPLNSTLSGSDPNGDTLTYIIDTQPSQGTLVETATGAFRYTPNANYFGSDSFTYHVSDATFSSTPSTVFLTVTPVNDVPVATSTSFSVIANTLTNSGHILVAALAGTDVENSPLSFTASTQPTNGTLVLSSTGALTYTPALGYVGVDSFTFRVNDGALSSAPATVTINVTTAYVPPVSNSGPGGGGGGGSIQPTPPVVAITTPYVPKAEPKNQTNTGTKPVTKDPEFNSAPEEQVPQFTLFDPTGLLSQLLLTNRILGSNNINLVNPIIEKTLVQKVFGYASNGPLDDFDGPALLRSMLQMFILGAENETDTVASYVEAIREVQGFDFSESKPLQKTQKYMLRILERNRKHYEELIYRDTVGRFEQDLNSASQ